MMTTSTTIVDIHDITGADQPVKLSPRNRIFMSLDDKSPGVTLNTKPLLLLVGETQQGFKKISSS